MVVILDKCRFDRDASNPGTWMRNLSEQLAGNVELRSDIPVEPLKNLPNFQLCTMILSNKTKSNIDVCGWVGESEDGMGMRSIYHAIK